MEKLKTNTLRTLFEPFYGYLNNDLRSASVFNADKLALFGVKMGLSCKFGNLSPPLPK